MTHQTKINLVTWILVLQAMFVVCVGLLWFFSTFIPLDYTLKNRAQVIAERELQKCYRDGGCAVTYGNTTKDYILLDFTPSH